MRLEKTELEKMRLALTSRISHVPIPDILVLAQRRLE